VQPEFLDLATKFLDVAGTLIRFCNSSIVIIRDHVIVILLEDNRFKIDSRVGITLFYGKGGWWLARVTQCRVTLVLNSTVLYAT